MNKIYLLLLTFFILNISLQAQLKVVATASMIADMAENIAGNDIEIVCIVPIGGDPHLYEPTPSDAKLVADADLILKNGLTFEGWLDELIANSGTKAKVITLTEGINVIQSSTYANSADPHAWMDAANSLFYIEHIKNAFTELNPSNKEVYEFNHGVYSKQIEELDEYISSQVKTIPELQRILITSHDAFQYYGRKYGIQLEAILGTSTDAEAQVSDIIRLNKVIKVNKVPAVFIESTINPKMLKELAASNDIQIGGELYADSIGGKDSPAPSYIDMLKHNTDVIVRALKREMDAANTNDRHNHGEEEDSSNLFVWGILGVLLVGGFLFVLKKMN